MAMPGLGELSCEKRGLTARSPCATWCYWSFSISGQERAVDDQSFVWTDEFIPASGRRTLSNALDDFAQTMEVTNLRGGRRSAVKR